MADTSSVLSVASSDNGMICDTACSLESVVVWKRVLSDAELELKVEMLNTNTTITPAIAIACICREHVMMTSKMTPHSTGASER